MTFPSSQKPKCPNHEEIELILSFTDKYGIEHEHIQNVCLNCQDQITFQTSDLKTPDIDIPTLEAAIAFIEQSGHKDIFSMSSDKRTISKLESLKRKVKHPEFQK